MANIFFWTSFFLITYTIILFPILMILFSLFLRKKIIMMTGKPDFIPTIDIIITVHNEEKSIASIIEQCLDLNYPFDKLNIIVASDGSTDNTEQIVKNYANNLVRYIGINFRGGKVTAQNRALKIADSDILVFMDANVEVSKSVLKDIVINFQDPCVGVVSCRDFIIDKQKRGYGEKQYIIYDMITRKFISQYSTLVGVSGKLYAVRNEIAKGGWNPAFPPDFYIALRAIKKGYRVVEDSRVQAKYRAYIKESAEFNRKVRTVNRGITTLLSPSNIGMLNPLKYGKVSFLLLSYKLFRWLIPFFLFVLLLSNIFLIGKSLFYNINLFFLVSFFVIIGLSFLPMKIFRNFSMFKFTRYFVVSNLAIIKAWFEFFTGKRHIMWQPTKR